MAFLITVAAAAHVLCIGELIWYALPSGVYLGGAPVNTAVHTANLGLEAKIATAVGNDRLGRLGLTRLDREGVCTSLVQTRDLETGFVEATLDAQGAASYEFLTPAAYDAIDFDNHLHDASRTCEAIVFGTLAQRSPASRKSIRQSVKVAADANRLVVYDVNLRMPHTPLEIVVESAANVDILKMNDDEAVTLSTVLDVESVTNLDSEGATDEDVLEATSRCAAAIGRAVNAGCVVITCGPRGAVMWDDDAGTFCNHGYTPPESAVVDTVGCGDAFLAGLVRERLRNVKGDESLETACRFGAYVAGYAGATPCISESCAALLRSRYHK